MKFSTSISNETVCIDPCDQIYVMQFVAITKQKEPNKL